MEPIATLQRSGARVLLPAPVRARLTPLVAPLRGGGLRAAAMRSSAWTIGGYAASQALRLVSNVTLTRLLFPDAFGWMLAVLAVVQGLQMFSDVGIGASIVQSKRTDRDFLNTAWTVQIVRGFLLWGVACLLAAPAAAFFEKPVVLWLLPLVGFQLVVTGFQSTAYFTASRNLELGRVTAAQLIAQAFGVVVMIAWALVDRSVVALAVGAIATPALNTVLTHTLLRSHPHRLRWERRAAHELFTFGRWIFLSTLLTFLAMQSDRIIFGRLIDADHLGVYAIAVNLAMLGTSILSRLAGRVLHPAYSRHLDRGGDLGAILPRVRMPVSVFAGASSAALAACAVPLVAVLYDPRYHDAAWMLQILAVSCLLQSAELSIGKALLALNRPQDLVTSTAVRLAGLLTLLPLGFWLDGMRGALAGLAAADVLKYACSVLLAHRQGLHALRHDLPIFGYAVASAALVLVAMEWIETSDSHEVWALAFAAAASGLLWMPWLPAVLRRVRGAAQLYETPGA